MFAQHSAHFRSPGF